MQKKLKEDKDYEVGFRKPPKNRQFGQPNGNKRCDVWKREDTARYKLEKAIKLSIEEIDAQLENETSSAYDAAMLNNIKQMKMLSADMEELRYKIAAEDDMEKRTKLTAYLVSMSESLTRIQEKLNNQVYGMPKATNVNLNAEADEEQRQAFIKGIFIPK